MKPKFLVPILSVIIALILIAIGLVSGIIQFKDSDKEVADDEWRNTNPESIMVISEEAFVKKIKDALLTNKVFDKYGKGEHTLLFGLDLNIQTNKAEHVNLFELDNNKLNNIDHLMDINKMYNILGKIPFKIPQSIDKKNVGSIVASLPIKINFDSQGNVLQDWYFDKNYESSCNKYVKSDLIDGEEPFAFVEQMPSYKGGNDELLGFFAKNIRYPEIAKRAGIEGKVMVEFVVDKQGKVRNARVLKGIGAGCDEEALRVTGMMKNWIPGRQSGKPVNVKMVIPIHFRLQD